MLSTKRKRHKIIDISCTSRKRYFFKSKYIIVKNFPKYIHEVIVFLQKSAECTSSPQCGKIIDVFPSFSKRIFYYSGKYSVNFRGICVTRLNAKGATHQQ